MCFNSLLWFSDEGQMYLLVKYVIKSECMTESISTSGPVKSKPHNFTFYHKVQTDSQSQPAPEESVLFVLVKMLTT